MNGNNRFRISYEPLLPGCFHLPSPYTYRNPFNETNPGKLAQLIAQAAEDEIQFQGPDSVAAFNMEPIQGAGGVIVPDGSFMKLMREICDRHGILFIADEVITGFGRTGNTWGCESYEFVPDAIISSKNLTAGFFPMGAVILEPDLTDRLQAASDAIEEFPHGFTASGHPVGCAIALKAIDVVMNEGLAENVRALTPLFEAGMARLAQHKNIGEWRGKGLMGALEAVVDKDTKQPFDGSLSVSERIANACTDQIGRASCRERV